MSKRVRNVSLTPELEAYVADQVASGRFRSAAEFIRECVRLKMAQDQEREVRLAALREAIAEGVRELDAGNWIDGPTAFAEVRRRLEEEGSG